jgi:hypothetical protein
MSADWLKYQEQIKIIAKNFGSEINYLGSGMEGCAWKIDDRYAIKIYRSSNKYKNTFLPELEIKIYDSGTLNDGTFWVIKDLFEIPKDIHKNLLEELIIEIKGYSEKQIQKAKWKKYSETFWLSEKAYNSFLKDSQEHNELIAELKENYKLADNWLYDLFVEITYKTLTRRGLDFHFGNLGIDKKKRIFIFFDW